MICFFLLVRRSGEGKGLMEMKHDNLKSQSMHRMLVVRSCSPKLKFAYFESVQ